MQDIRVLVINPPNSPYTDPNLLIEPIDVLSVASYIKSLGYRTTFIDMDIECLPASSIESILKAHTPDFTVIPFDYHIPLFTSESIGGVQEIAKNVLGFGSRLIIGGRPSNSSPGLFLDESQRSVVIIGEMEPSLEELLSNSWNESSLNRIDGIIYMGAKGIVTTPKRTKRIDFDSLPIPDRSLASIGKYIEVRTMLSSRGCVEKCSFCPVHGFWGIWRAKSAQKVVDEIKELIEKFEAKKILFLDDHATASPKRMREISRELISRKIETTLGCLGTVSCYDPETVELMYQAGFRWLHYGAEFGDDQTIKGMNKRTSVSQIRKAIAGTKAAGLRVRASWILDAPQATIEGLDATIELIIETEPDEVRAHFLSLRAGAPLAQRKSDLSSPINHQQYIHAAKPHSALSLIDPETLNEKVEFLTTQLAGRGYDVISKSEEWAEYKKINNKHARFISFCPGRYGVGWVR